MKNLNKYQKMQLILAILIIISIIGLVVSAYQRSNRQKLWAQETIAEASQDIDKLEEEPINEIEGDLDEIEGDTSWDEEVEESSEVDVKQEENSEENNSAKYYLKINYKANVVTVYTKDSSGKYTVPVKALICSTGTATPTSGVFRLGQKYRWHTLNGGVKGQYCTRITGHILFHSVPYSKESPDSLKYTAYDKLGTKASCGCIRLTVEDALWIYNNCPSGTYVEFYSSNDPGPLGKPTAKKISQNIACRNWDPTDPDPRNPWRNYVEPEVNETHQLQPTQEVNNNQNQQNNQPQSQPEVIVPEPTPAPEPTPEPEQIPTPTPTPSPTPEPEPEQKPTEPDKGDTGEDSEDNNSENENKSDDNTSANKTIE